MTITRNCTLAALLAFGMLVGGSAFAATNENAVPYAESFENLSDWGGSYTNINVTNGWYSGVNDLSVITNMIYDIPACGAPLTNATVTHTNVLKLSTEDTILTNSFGSGFDMATTITYVDTMVQFVASEDTPTVCVTGTGLSDGAAGTKLAIYANATTNLAIYHGVYSASGYASNTITVISNVALTSTDWYRLTIVYDATVTHWINGDFPTFKVLTNGTEVISSHAYTQAQKDDFVSTGNYPAEPSEAGTWFAAATIASSVKTLRSLCLQGTGYIDDLVVTNGAVSYASGLGAYLLTVVTGSGGNSATGGVNFATSLWTFSVSAGSSTSIVYTANDWYLIQSLTKDGASVGAAAGLKSYTQQLDSISAPISNNVTFVTNSLGAVVSQVPSSYALDNNVDEAWAIANSNAMQQGYMLGTEPTTNGALTISAINVIGTNLEVTVQLKTNNVALNTTINGWLLVDATTNLSVGFTGAYKADLQYAAFTNTGTHVVSFTDADSNKFYKASITLTDPN